MAAFQRAQVATLTERLREPPERIIALFGPRQTGKTTIVDTVLRPTDRYLPVDEPDPAGLGLMVSAEDSLTVGVQEKRDTRWLVRNWEEARLDAERQPDGCVLAIDEVHKIRDGQKPSRDYGMPTAPGAAHCTS